MKRILILSDSLALPRETPELCTYENTWPQLIQGDHKIHQISIGGATSSDLVKQISYIKLFNPDLVFVQVGIVDCAPRFLSKFEQEFIRKIPFVSKQIMGLLNREGVRRSRKISYVSPMQFRSNLKKIIESFNQAQVWFIPIIEATPQYETLLPGISKQVQLYNSIILEVSNNQIQLENIDLDGIMSDHHHLNENGHQQIAQQINVILKGDSFT